MKFVGQIIPSLVVVFLTSLCARADDLAVAENPYAAIVARNVFNLVPMPTNPPPDTKPVDPPSKITPNGIMTLFGQLQVLFKVAVPNKPGQPVVPEQSYVLSVGERQDDIEVTKVDKDSGMITFNNHGVVQELPLTKTANLASPVASAGRPGVPLVAPPRGLPMLPPNMRNRFGEAHGYGNPSAATENNPNASATPSFGGAIPNGGAVPNNNNVQLTPEAQVIMMEKNRLDLQSQGDPTANLIPPTVITPDNNGEPSP